MSPDIPDELQGRPLLQKIWKRMHRRNRNYMGAMVGPTGSGKSWAALRMAELIDPDFTVDQVAFSVGEFVELVNEDHPPGSVIVMDEAGVSMDSHTWYNSDQIQLGHILETWRHQNRAAIFTLPDFSGLQKSARGRMHALMETWGINYQEGMSRLRYRYIQQNPAEGDIYKKYHRFTNDIGVEEVCKFLYLKTPSRSLRRKYDNRKESYTEELNQQIQDSLGDAEEPAETDPMAVAEEIIDSGDLDTYVSQHPVNKSRYIDADLLEVDQGLSARKAKQVKKLIEREVDLDLEEEHTDASSVDA